MLVFVVCVRVCWLAWCVLFVVLFCGVGLGCDVLCCVVVVRCVALRVGVVVLWCLLCCVVMCGVVVLCVYLCVLCVVVFMLCCFVWVVVL